MGNQCYQGHQTGDKESRKVNIAGAHKRIAIRHFYIEAVYGERIMMLSKGLVAVGIMFGLMSLAACGRNIEPQTAYQGGSEPGDKENPPMTASSAAGTAETSRSADVSEASTASSSAAESSAAAVFDTAYLGYVGGLFDEGFDEGFPKWLKENNEALLNKYPYIAEIDKEHIIGGAGHLYLIAPTDRNATLSINRIEWNEEKQDYEPTEVIYRSESGEPILLFANLDGVAYEPDTQVFITDNSGNTCEWYPSLDAMSYIVPCSAENGTCLSKDLSLYSHGLSAKYAEWLNDGWLGPTALGLAGSDTSGIIWFIDDTAWETNRKASFMLTFYPMDGAEGKVELDWLYEGEKEFEEQWSGFWSLETELDSPSLLTLSLSRVGGENFNAADGPMYISGTYPIMISRSGEELIFARDKDQASLPFMAQNTQICTLYAGTWTE